MKNTRNESKYDLQNFPQAARPLKKLYLLYLVVVVVLRDNITGPSTCVSLFWKKKDLTVVVLHFFARKIQLFGVKMTNTVVVLLLVLVFAICGITEGK